MQSCRSLVTILVTEPREPCGFLNGECKHSKGSPEDVKNSNDEPSALQVMLYRSLLMGLAEASEGALAAEILQLHKLDGKAQLGKEASPGL